MSDEQLFPPQFSAPRIRYGHERTNEVFYKALDVAHRFPFAQAQLSSFEKQISEVRFSENIRTKRYTPITPHNFKAFNALPRAWLGTRTVGRTDGRTDGR